MDDQDEMEPDLVHLHASVTPERVREMVERRMTSLDNPGVCFACGFEADGCEPDAEGYECEACGEAAVMGCETAWMHLGELE